MIYFVHSFEKDRLKQILKFAAYEFFFVFDNDYYCQNDNIAMGSLLGLFYHYEKQWLSNCPPDFQTQIFTRYVDIFVTFTLQAQLKSFVN